jgi:hypothetical protein
MPSRWRNERLWAASESCPRLDQGSTARPPGGGFRRVSEASPAAFDHGLDRQLDHKLDRDRAAASFSRRDRLLVPDCDRGLNSPRVSFRRRPAAAD